MSDFSDFKKNLNPFITYYYRIIINELIDISVTYATSHPVTGTRTLPYSFLHFTLIHDGSCNAVRRK